MYSSSIGVRGIRSSVSSGSNDNLIGNSEGAVGDAHS